MYTNDKTVVFFSKTMAIGKTYFISYKTEKEGFNWIISIFMGSITKKMQKKISKPSYETWLKSTKAHMLKEIPYGHCS